VFPMPRIFNSVIHIPCYPDDPSHTIRITDGLLYVHTTIRLSFVKAF